MDGTPTKFSVEQIQSAPTLTPVTRPPPAYPEGSMKYSTPEQSPPNPPTEDHEAQREREKITTGEPAVETVDTPTVPETSSTSPAQIGGRKSNDSKPSRQYAIIRDATMGQNYACELKEATSEMPIQAHLFARAKGGSYQPIWYDPEDLLADPPRSRAAKTCPRGWKPWLTPVGEGWEQVGQPVSHLSRLNHKLIHKER